MQRMTDYDTPLRLDETLDPPLHNEDTILSSAKFASRTTSPPAATVHWFTKLQLAATYT